MLSKTNREAVKEKTSTYPEAAASVVPKNPSATKDKND
jgi:hypothetical protein